MYLTLCPSPQPFSSAVGFKIRKYNAKSHHIQSSLVQNI